MSGLDAATRGLQALKRQFPHVDADALLLFAEHSEGAMDAETLAALVEMQREAEASASAGQGGRAFLPVRGGNVTQNASNADDPTIEISFEGGADPPHIGTVLQIRGLQELCTPAEGLASAAFVVPTGEVLAVELQADPAYFFVSEYGMHELRIRVAGGVVRCCQFMVSSHLGEFAAALDHFHDACDWVWDGKWTDDLEEATMGMLVALDEQFAQLNTLFQRSVMMGDAIRSTMDPPKRRIENYMAKAIEMHDTLALGRAEAAVRGLVLAQSMLEMFGPMLGGGLGAAPLIQTPFYQAVMVFEKARFSAASEAKQKEVKEVIARLITATDAHVAELYGGKEKDFIARWQGGLREALVQMRDDPEAVIHPLPFQQLRGGGGGYMADMMASMVDTFGGQSGEVQRAETTEAMSTLRPQATFAQADGKMTRWTESLVDDSVMFGSPMSPFELNTAEPFMATVLASIQCLLTLGFGYVTQGSDDSESSKVCALLNRVRASLSLSGEEEFLRDHRRRDRLKDVCRVVRSARKRGQRLSLSVNTDFQGALQALRQHHTDNWVGPSLQAVWERMVQEHQAFAFELWLHDAPASSSASADSSSPVKPPRLIAADFGHPHTYGRAYYVATRFFDREFRTLQPGFILAFAEAACLKQAGFELWDLGGTDASPMMQYKPQVAIEMDRSDFLRRLREVSGNGSGGKSRAERNLLPLSDPEAAPPACGRNVPTGIVFEDIGEDELWGSRALRDREERAKAAHDALQKAAKFRQKPPKAARKTKNPAPATAPTPAPEAAPATAPATTPAAAPTAAPATAPAAAPAAASAADSAKAVPSSAESDDAAKAEIQRQFKTLFQQLVAEGLSQNEAAAKALRLISTR